MFHLHDVSVGSTLVWITVFRILEQDAVHVGARILEQLVGVVEDDQSDLAITQDAQLVRFLHQTKLTLRKRHLRHKCILAVITLWSTQTLQ